MKWVWLYKQGAAHWLAGTVILKSCQFPRAPLIACWSELWRSDDNYLVWVVSSHNDSSSWQPLGLLVSPPMIIAHPKFSHSAAKVLPVNNATKRVGAVSGGNGARNPDCLTRRLSATTLQTPTLGSPWWWNLVLLIKWSSIGTKFRKNLTCGDDCCMVHAGLRQVLLLWQHLCFRTSIGKIMHQWYRKTMPFTKMPQ